MKFKSIFWGGLFMLAGALMLLSNLGILMVNVWKLIWPTFIIAVGAWTLWTATRGPEALDVEEINIPHEDAAQAKVSLNFGAGQVTMNSGASGGNLLKGTFAGGLDYHAKKAGDTLDVSLKPSAADFIHTFMPWSWGAREWDIQLNEQIPFALDVETGASSMELDLSKLRVTELNLSTGASSTEVTLPANAGHTHVDVEGGAASIIIRIPEGVAARIQIDGGLAAIAVDRDRFPRVGDVYKSSDYETAANKVDINADFGAGSLSIE
ncbi:MAG: hypothetical protein B6I38_05645 [Anaerolineaceae bacterium 4572_5.1]|nr:MAG: hypothetical protein B5M51_06660 [Anaerolinea sp. 4484_236]OQY31582.1 MAG: hypothetical protein B6I38_05645 [Anaerolineaceae bacterium 4572_5.1]